MAADDRPPRIPRHGRFSPAATRRRAAGARGSRREILVAARGMLGWVVLVASCYGLAEAGRVVRVPAAALAVPLAAGIILALAGVVRSPLPRRAGRTAQALMGVVMGSHLQPEALRSLTVTTLPLLAVTVATIACCGAAAYWLARTTEVPMADAVLGMVPGGSAGVISCAADLGADPRRVAFAQYLRVAFIALTAPLIMQATSGVHPAPAGPPAFDHWVQQPRGISSVLILAGICLVGSRLGQRARLPAPTLLGPMALAVVVTFTHTWSGFAPAGPLQDLLFVVIGLEVGLQFTRSAIRGAVVVLPRLCLAIVTVSLVCAGLSWAAAAVAGLTFGEAYLATTPGGINAVLATAVTGHGNLALITTVQSLRLLLVLLLMPTLIRLLAARAAMR